MRVFAALPLPSSVSMLLAAALEPVRAAEQGIRWVSPAGFHVTLHFFGEVEAAQVPPLKAAMADARLRLPAVDARLGEMGQFPARGTPRVVWVSLSQGSEQARVLWEVFEQVVEPLGWRRDPRGFMPHITVGRAGKDGSSPVDGSTVAIPQASFCFDEIVLFESILGRDGAIYRPEVRVPLDPGVS